MGLKGGTIHLVQQFAVSEGTQTAPTYVTVPLIWAPQWWDMQYTQAVGSTYAEGQYEPTYIHRPKFRFHCWASNEATGSVQLLNPVAFAIRVATLHDIGAPDLPGNIANIYVNPPRNYFLRDYGHLELNNAVGDATTTYGPSVRDRVIHRDFALVQFGDAVAGAGNNFTLPNFAFRCPSVRLRQDQALVLDVMSYTVYPSFEAQLSWCLSGTFGYRHYARR